MEWSTGVSESPDTHAAVLEASAPLRAAGGMGRPDLLLVFATPGHVGSDGSLVDLVHEALAPGVLVGCSARSVIGGGREVEHRPGLALVAAWMPGVEMRGVRLGEEAATDPESRDASESVASRADPPRHLLLFADPFSCDADALLPVLDARLPGGVKLGGLASGGVRAGTNALLLGDAVYRDGVVGVTLQGNLELDAFVAHGCRPVGSPMFVTACRGNVLLELDGVRALDAVATVLEGLPAEDRALAREGLFLGIEMQPARDEYRAGEFLIRNVVGADEARSGVVVGALPQVGQVVQLHLRDARAAAQDLDRRLETYARERARRGGRVAGALLFSCLGRGERLYGKPDHDSTLLRRHLGDVPLGGFFCNGEIGPVGGRSVLHGYTSAFGLFCTSE